MTAVQVYSIANKAGFSARKLKLENKIIYDLLYVKKIEMLYFIVDKQLEPIIKISKGNDSSNANDLIYALDNIIRS